MHSIILTLLVRGRLHEVKNAEDSSGNENPEVEYDPFNNRPDGPLTSDFDAFMHLLKSSLGTGVLFLPNAFRRTGYVMSVVCGIVVAIVSTHTAIMLVRCAQLLCRRNRMPSLDFAKTAEVSFRTGPAWIRKYGKTFGVVTNVIICLLHFQTAVIYILYIATSFQQVIEFFSDFKMDPRIYILIFFPLTCALGLISNLKHLAPFSLIGFLFLALGVCVTFYYQLADFPDPGRLNLFTQVLSVPMYCSIFLFALHNMTLYLPLENTMKNPRHLPQLIVCSMLINTCLYIAFGFLGYNKYPYACDTVIKNLPIRETLAQTVKVAISLSVMLTFGLVYYVPINILWSMIQARIKTNCYYEILFRLAGIIVTTLLAISVPEMVPLLGLFSALSMTTIMLLIPVVIETAIMWEEASRVLLAKNIGISVIWFLLLVFGAIESTWSIIREYGHQEDDDCSPQLGEEL